MDELLNQLLALLEKPQEKQSIVVILTGCDLHTEVVFQSLLSYQANLSISILYSDEYEIITSNQQWKQLGQEITDKKELIPTIQQASLVLIPSLSRDLLVKAALCIGDTHSSYALQVALMQNKKVIALDSGVNLELDYWKMQGLNKNENYNKSLNLFEEKLIDFGVELTNIFDFPIRFETFMADFKLTLDSKVSEKSLKNSMAPENFISSDIVTYQEIYGRTELTISQDAKLTDLAHDYVLKNQIPINRI